MFLGKFLSVLAISSVQGGTEEFLSRSARNKALFSGLAFIAIKGQTVIDGYCWSP